MTPPKNCKCDVIHCVPCSGAGPGVQAASKVSSVVGLVDVKSVAGEVVVPLGDQGEQDYMLVCAAWNRLAELQMTTRRVWQICRAVAPLYDDMHGCCSRVLTRHLFHIEQHGVMNGCGCG